MGQDNTMNNNQNDETRRPQQQDNQGQQQQPGQQNQQADPNRQGGQNAGQSGQRIDTDGDGRTRDPNDTRPTDDGGRGEPVQR